MAITTVRISDKVNRDLDRLQARLRLRSGKRVTKQSIIESLIERALDEEEPLVMLRAPKYPLSEKKIRALLKFPLDSGVETNEEEIDRILYEEDK
jgi:hypothetical protein